MFRTKTASIFELIVMHAKISNAPLQSALNLALPLALSDLVWLTLVLSLVLSGAHRVLARLSTSWTRGHS